MSRHIYVKFDFELPDEFEKLYKKQLRHEEYLLEKDALGSAIFFDELSVVPTKILEAIIRNQEAEQAEREAELEQKKLLRKAMSKLREAYPKEEECVRLYYFGKMTQSDIARKKKITQPMVSKLLNRGIGHLKEYVDTYKKQG